MATHASYMKQYLFSWFFFFKFSTALFVKAFFKKYQAKGADYNDFFFFNWKLNWKFEIERQIIFIFIILYALLHKRSLKRPI